MSEQDSARRAPMHYIATARAYCFDLAAMAFLFVSASVMAGRVWRFPFDDEIATLSKIEADAARACCEFSCHRRHSSSVLLSDIPWIASARPLRRGHAAVQSVHDLGGARAVPNSRSELAFVAHGRRKTPLAYPHCCSRHIRFDATGGKSRRCAALVSGLYGADDALCGDVPYQAIFDFIDRNANGSALVISTDPVVPWVLRGAEGRCAGYFFDVWHCLQSGRRYDSIFVVFGHHDRSSNATFMHQFKIFIDEATAGRMKLTSVSAGYDADAELKTRLTGVPLDPAILTVDFYR